MTNQNYFIELSKIDVSNHLEKKGKFNYLSWTFAVKALREYDPTATWEVVRFDGLPYLKTEAGHFVEVNVTVQGVTLGQIHPVLNNNNKPIEKPNSFDINTSIQRCLVKAIALHGLGLFVFAGEDLPMDTPVNSVQIGAIKTLALEFASMRGKKEADVYTALKVKDITKLTEGQASELITKLESWVEAAKKDHKEAKGS